ncbi:MAG: hypothetical protein [Caudoviricetes sp.]|nr:MAG: hypothetical protein [Caudoviricetes sp.]
MTKGDRDKLRAELAGKVAAAIVSTIKDDDDYSRIWNMANKAGLSTTEWIASESVHQADDLMAELGIKGEE